MDPLLLWIFCRLQPCFSPCHLHCRGVLPDLNCVVQCTGCQVLHTLCLDQWLSKGQDSAESDLGNLNLNHCKCNHTWVQHFFASQQDGRRNTRKPCVTSTALRCSCRLLFLLREFAALLQQYLPKPNPKLQQLQAGPKGTCPVTNAAKLNPWHLGLGKSLTKT